MPFAYRATCTLTSDSARLPSTQTNYRLWVDITNNALKLVANGGFVTDTDGDDVVPFGDFGLSSTQFDFELEKYDGTAGRWIGHVVIPTAALGTVFYFGIGNPAITTLQGTPTAPWSTDKGVYHFNLPLSGGAGRGRDASANANNGVLTGTTNGSGKLNEGQIFDGSTAQISIADHATLQLGTGDFTISAWVKATDTTKGPTQQNTIVSKDFTGVELFIYEGLLACYIGGTDNICIGDDILADNTDYYVSVIRSGTAVKTLVNGVVDGTATNGANASNIGADFYIGRRQSDGSADLRFAGTIDEVRISGVARSVDWERTNYQSQNDPANFMSTSFAPVVSNVGSLLAMFQ